MGAKAGLCGSPAHCRSSRGALARAQEAGEHRGPRAWQRAEGTSCRGHGAALRRPCPPATGRPSSSGRLEAHGPSPVASLRREPPSSALQTRLLPVVPPLPPRFGSSPNPCSTRCRVSVSRGSKAGEWGHVRTASFVGRCSGDPGRKAGASRGLVLLLGRGISGAGRECSSSPLTLMLPRAYLKADTDAHTVGAYGSQTEVSVPSEDYESSERVLKCLASSLRILSAEISHVIRFVQVELRCVSMTF